ncbi:MAG: hypothetical protein ABSG68_10615 [Thermoguttaceae bacterium]|jgi:hypothetical protein
MKHILFGFAAVSLLAVLAGCCCDGCHNSGNNVVAGPGERSGPGSVVPGAVAAHGPAVDSGPAGPPVGAQTYPYYTTRGPRDFLARNPESIGP